MFWYQKIEFNDINNDELLHIQHSQLLLTVKMWTYGESGWPINSIKHQLVSSEIAPCEKKF